MRIGFVIEWNLGGHTIVRLNYIKKGGIGLEILQKANGTAAGLHGFYYDVYGLPFFDRVEGKLRKILSDSKGVIRDMCNHTLKAGGKRIRPFLVLGSGLIFSGISEELVNAAAAAELIHMASLVHDDIIDDSPIRRNRPSVNSMWGTHFAVLCGDYLFAKAFGILSSNRLPDSLDCMVEAIENMCDGEILQAGDRFNCETTIEEYYNRIAKKTGIFLKCCCKSGASIAGANKKQIDLLAEFGLQLGYAFQIIDDVMDFCGDSNVMGKPRGGDLKQGIITLPVIFLLQDQSHGNWVRKAILAGNLDGMEREKICRALDESGTLSKTFDIAAEHIEKAKQCLKGLPESVHTDFLRSLADKLQNRAN